MPKFTRKTEVDAYQIVFDEQSKESAKKGIPTSSHGVHIRYDEGKFSVLVGQQHAFETDWVVKENGMDVIYTDENFKALFSEVVEVVAAEELAEGASETSVPAEAKVATEMAEPQVDPKVDDAPATTDVAPPVAQLPVEAPAEASVSPVDQADVHGAAFTKEEDPV